MALVETRDAILYLLSSIFSITHHVSRSMDLMTHIEAKMFPPAIYDYPARFQYRFCPLCATPLERAERDGHERLVCPRDGWVLYPTPNLAATVVVEHAGGIVLLRRAIEPDVGIWHLPIGHLEFGEPPGDAARREA